jgi:peptidoglycan/LPS O-acetylase OafA/YrhL
VPHQPALDGLRGLAVAGVLAYHCGFSFFVGGYLAVSTFFTLSGFLITSLLLDEHARTGTVGLGAFWSRRLRRLLPASLATLAAVVTVFAWFFATDGQRSSLAPDVLASLADVANWRFIAEGTSYGASFDAPSPVLHFWSLSLEEQLYLVLPPLVLVVLQRCRGRALVAAGVFAALAASLALVPLAVSLSDDQIYFSTPTRAPEFLVGVVLAALVRHAPLRRRLAFDGATRSIVAAVGAVALAVQLWWWWALDQGTGWLYRGGFAGYSLLSAAVVLAAILPGGPLRRGLDVAWLRWLGRRSYALYLWHWPIFLAVRQSWPEGSPWQWALVALPVTFVVAQLSSVLLEEPVRSRRWPRPRLVLPSALGAVLVVLALTAASAVSAPERIDFVAEAESFEQQQGPAEGSSNVPTVMTVGDSTALLAGMGLGFWGEHSGRLRSIGGDAEFACPLIRVAVLELERPTTPDEACTDWESGWAQQVQELDPSIVQVVTGVWDVADVRLSPDGDVTSIADAGTAEFIVDELSAAVDVLSANGALVVFVLWPSSGEWASGVPDAERARLDPARTQHFHALQRRVAAQRPDVVRVLDLSGSLGQRVDDPELRPDGVHIATEDMFELYDEGLGDELVQIHERWLRRGAGPGG